MEFEVKGKIVFGKGDERNFTKLVEAKSEKHAKELVYSLFGSHNGVKRSKIKIEEVVKHG